jgi:hypothetical protein
LKGVRYKNRVLKWDTVIEQKATELGHYIIRGSDGIDFSEPCPKLERTDGRELREAVVRLSQSEALKLGIDRSTLSYPREKAKSKIVQDL